MRPAGVFHLYRVRVRARLAQELLAVAGIAVGVALVLVALVANASLTSSVRAVDDVLLGDVDLQLVAPGPEGMDAQLLRAARRIDGVAAVAPGIEAQADLVGPRGQRSILLIGVRPRDARLGGAAMRRLAASSLPPGVSDMPVVALPETTAEAVGTSTGQRLRLQVGGRTRTVTVGTTLERHDYGTFALVPAAIAPLAFAQEAAGMRGRVSRIFVRTAPGRERAVRSALVALAAGRANVWGADHDVRAFSLASFPVTSSTAIFSVFAALIGFLLAFSAVLLTTPQRRRFVADLRLAGHEPWVVGELLLFDALMLGLAGALLGLLAGDAASQRLFTAAPSFLTFAFPIGDLRVVTWQSVAIAVATGLLAALVAVLLPLRDVLLRWGAERAASADGFGPGARGAAAGCATLAFATAIFLLAPQAGIAALGAMAACVLLLLPSALRAMTGAFEALTRPVRTPVPTLAALELRSRATRARAYALAATGAIAVFATVAVGGSHADLQRGLDRSARAIDANADVWVSFPGTTNGFATTPLRASAATVAALRRLPGVAHVGVYRGSFLDVGDRRTWIQAPPRSAPELVDAGQLRTGDGAVANTRLRAGGWIVLSKAIADQLGARVGDRVTLPTAVPTPLRVAAISTNLGWPPGAAVVNADDYARAWGTRAPTALQVRVTPGVPPVRVAAAVRRALPSSLPAQVETQAARIARHEAAARQGLRRLTQISIVVLVAAIAAMGGAMGGMIWQRRPAIAALKVHGYPERELWAALLLESALLLGTGCLVGAVGGLYMQAIMTRAMVAMTDFPIVYAPAGATALGILAGVTILALAMIALPGWLAVRVPATPGGATMRS